MNNIQELLDSFDNNSLFWGNTYFPHHFRDTGPLFHIELCKEAHKNRHLAVAAPRGSAKSTILAFIYPFHQICHAKVHFVVIVANTFKKASLHLEAMKAEVRENEMLNKHYKIEVTKDAEGDSEFRINGTHKIKVLCKGVEQIGSIRGVKFGAYRPDLIIGDDMEDDILVRNPQRRQELRDVYDEALVPAGEPHKCQYIMIGTILHDDCQIAKLTSEDYYQEYKKLFYKAESDDGKLLWPERITREMLDKLRKEKPNVYAKEYQNDPIAGSNTRFKPEYFRYYSIHGDSYVLLDKDNNPIYKGALSDCKAAISCDLAWKEKRSSDSTAILPGLLTQNSEILILPYIEEKGMRPNKLAEHLFYLEDKLHKMTGSTVKIGFEKAMLENVTKWLLKQEMKKRNHFLSTQDLVWDGDKQTRIETRLQPRYIQNVIYHQRDMGELEHQLLRFPYGAHDDIIDALQGLVQLLQFPKQMTKPQKDVDDIDIIRGIMKKSLTKKKKRSQPLLTGKKRFGIPCIQSFSRTLPKRKS